MKAKLTFWAQAAGIILAGLGAFWPALAGDWIWDDGAEVAGNAVLRDPHGLVKIWVAPAGADYFPLKTTVQWLAWQAWGDSRVGFHLLTLGLHLLSALLFWRLLRRWLEGGLAPWLGGLALAVHPLTVESVAWVAELKNTLSLAALLGAMMKAVDWERAERAAPELRSSGAAAYWQAWGWFLVALLCKTSVVMFPGVLLLYLRWRRGRLTRREVAATLPFFGVALALGLVTLAFQEHRALLGAEAALGSWSARAAAGGMAVIFYAGKILWPVNLIPIYPHWAIGAPALGQFLPWLVVGAVGVWLSGPSRRGAAFAFGSFAVLLLPVLGFLPMAYLRLSAVADHLAYLPLLGLLGAAAAGIGQAKARGPGPARGAVAAAVLGCALLGLAGWRQARIYRSDESFWTAVVARNPQAWLAQNDLGLDLAGAGRTEEAIAHYQAALRLQPDYPEARNNLGNALVRRSQFSDAIAAYGEALRLEPHYVDARRNLGNALAQIGRLAEAKAQYEEVLRTQPSDAATHGSLGYVLAGLGQSADALREYTTAVRLDPASAEAHDRLGDALGNAGQLARALQEYQAALQIRPDYAEARANLGLALASAHRGTEAVAELERALQLRPDYAVAHAYLGFALAQIGRYAEAVAQYQAALQAGLGSVDLHFNLADALRALGRTAEARAEYDRAAELEAAAAAARR